VVRAKGADFCPNHRVDLEGNATVLATMGVVIYLFIPKKNEVQKSLTKLADDRILHV